MMFIYYYLRVLIATYIIHIVNSQRLGLGINNNGGVDVVRHERYEYHNPHHRQPHGMDQGPFDGILPGIIITIASSYLQWWNEGRAVSDAKLISTAQKELVELDSTADIDTINNGKLIHITGYLSTQNGLTDTDHGLHRKDALQLIRLTEEYQWKETKSERRTRVSETEVKVATEYRYHKEWSKRYRDSNMFESPEGHYNPPPSYQLGQQIYTVNDAKLSGSGFHIRPDLLKQISSPNYIMKVAGGDNFQSIEYKRPINLGMGEDLPHLDAVISPRGLYYSSEIGNYLQQPSYISYTDNKPLEVIDDTKQRTPVVKSEPQPIIGDVRVNWREVVAPSDGVSILAQQYNNELIPWYNPNNNNDRGYIYSLLPGQYTSKEMIEKHIEKHKLITKILRITGWVGSYYGLSLILGCIPAKIRTLPFGIGSFIQPLANIATSTIAFGVSVGLSGTVMALAWLRFRPFLATALAFISGLGLVSPFSFARMKRTDDVVDAKSE